jgi:hypothetical protein
LLDNRLFAGMRAHWQTMLHHNTLPAQLSRLTLPATDASVASWIEWLLPTQAVFSVTSDALAEKYVDSWWLAETQNRVNAILTLVQDYLPWLLPEFEPLRTLPELASHQDVYTLTLDEAATFSERLAEAVSTIAENPALHDAVERLRAALTASTQNLRSLIASLRGIAQQAEDLAKATEFAFLIDPGRQILSIGYDVRAQKLHDACYDLIASEARIATFLAIARDEVHQQSWFRLSREHARAFGCFLLISWTGTMFEYLMPALWMRSYPETLIARTLSACVKVQRAFAGTLNIPWGISESGSSRKDDFGHYHYQAYGVPQTALSAEATAGPVISPYSSFLALAVDAVAAIRNLRRMAAAGWVGAYGFYEAADYSTAIGKPIVVREWMAHHEGMSLLAILNLLQDNVVQRWFHSHPEVQATELLLHEKPVGNAVLRAKMKE